MNPQDWPSRRVTVTGGAGFLGQAVVSPPQVVGATDIFVARSRDYDLRTVDGIDRVIADGRPQLVIQLEAVVGPIGPNLENLGRFFYENAIMGTRRSRTGSRAGRSTRPAADADRAAG
jgi:GDP-L-fucose synthase